MAAYEPLPNPVCEHRSWWRPQLSLNGPERSARLTLAELRRREPGLCDEAWSGSPERQEYAKWLSSLIKEKMALPSDCIIPQDSFYAIVLAGDSGDGMDIVECMMDVEDSFGVDIPQELAQRFGSMTFGEVVDCLMSLPHKRELIHQVPPGQIERQACPSSSVFWDIRKFGREKLGLDRRRMRPATALKELLRGQRGDEVDHFLWRRFGVRHALNAKVLGILPVLPAAVVLWIPGTILVWWKFGSAWGVAFAMGGIFPLALILAFLTWPTWPHGVVTVRDLVRWVLKERERAKPAATALELPPSTGRTP